MSKIVGVKIDQKDNKGKSKVYYYKTNKDYKEGDVINIRVPSGGTPPATVVKVDVKKKTNGRKLKTLKEE